MVVRFGSRYERMCIYAEGVGKLERSKERC